MPKKKGFGPKRPSGQPILREKHSVVMNEPWKMNFKLCNAREHHQNGKIPNQMSLPTGDDFFRLL
jgi:hypothetical protein